MRRYGFVTGGAVVSAGGTVPLVDVFTKTSEDGVIIFLIFLVVGAIIGLFTEYTTR